MLCVLNDFVGFCFDKKVIYFMFKEIFIYRSFEEKKLKHFARIRSWVCQNVDPEILSKCKLEEHFVVTNKSWGQKSQNDRWEEKKW